MERFLASMAACSLGIGCVSDPVAPDPIPSISVLRAAPTTVTLSGETLRLVPYVYRDFQPVSPPDGRAMIALLHVQTTSGSAFPMGVRVDSAWVVFGQEVWTASVEEGAGVQLGGPMGEWVIRNGPKWGPGVNVDVIVGLRTSIGSTSLLRAPDQLIQRTD
jgi:hypothetical protein